MMQRAGGVYPEDVERVRARFQGWRAARKPGRAIPSELWRDAVRLARAHGLYEVSRAIPVDYGALKKHMEGNGEGLALPRFVELAPRASAATSVWEGQGAFVELSGVDGARMTIRLPAGEVLDVVGLVSAFQRRVS